MEVRNDPFDPEGIAEGDKGDPRRSEVDQPLADSREDWSPVDLTRPPPLLRDRITKKGPYVAVGGGQYYSGKRDHHDHMLALRLFPGALEEIPEEPTEAQDQSRKTARVPNSTAWSLVDKIACALIWLLTGILLGATLVAWLVELPEVARVLGALSLWGLIVGMRVLLSEGSGWNSNKNTSTIPDSPPLVYPVVLQPGTRPGPQH